MHLTYCMNVHPGESFHDQWNAIRDCALPLRDALGWSGPFGLGLWLGNAASVEAQHHPDFAAWCREQGIYVFTINGFPYGNFHRAPVKSDVYRPDWSIPARRDYTMRLADLLASWLPPGVTGSISTVPVGYAPDDVPRDIAARHLTDVAAHLAHMDREIVIGLEPEPGCVLETTADVISFFNDHLLAAAGEREAMVRKHIGVCVDTCHCALAYESPAEVIRTLQREGIRIAKIQLSAALQLTPTARVGDALAPYAEPVYLHQVAARGGDGVRRWPDLPEAMRDLEARADWEEARVHFHVPLDWAGDAVTGSTRENMDDDFLALVRGGCCPHLEIETYTFGVLPGPMADRGLLRHLAAEFRWVMDRLGPA